MRTEATAQQDLKVPLARLVLPVLRVLMVMKELRALTGTMVRLDRRDQRDLLGRALG